MLVIDEMKDRRRVMLDTDEGVGVCSGAATTGRRVLASWAQVERLGGADGAGDGVTRRGAGGGRGGSGGARRKWDGFLTPSEKFVSHFRIALLASCLPKS